MFYVSIEKGVLDKVMEKAKSNENEIIGILVGKIEDHTIVISDAVSGEQEQGSTRASLPPSTIAKVTDQILKGEVEGRIVGWYHSHPGFGLFMSQTDINTQQNLQQFSSMVTALIVDPDCEEFGFFTLHGTQGVIQLEDNQVHVYEEGDEEIPERFSQPPKIPKKIHSRKRPGGGIPPSSQRKGPNTKIMTIGIAVAVAFAAISALIFYKDLTQDPNVSTVDEFELIGDNQENQQGIPIFKGDMEIRTKITVSEGSLTHQGVRFYMSNSLGTWDFIGNDSIPINNTYAISIDSNNHGEHLHQIKVNFTDSLDHTWEGISDAFIIDNIPDAPNVRFIDPEDGDKIKENVTFRAVITDLENNLFNVSFYYLNQSGNWSIINDTNHWMQEDEYIAKMNTNILPNGTYIFRVEATDRNLYMGWDEITVTISNGE
jgi:proteasome lid subunit RPN8/RPN11